jgi:O-antigen/teichoic acid export membrane protein
MLLRRNIIASYASQLYVTLAGIAMVPLYLRYMGTEAYGLVGLFVMLQAWLQLLDVGLTPTISRETARFAGGAGDALGLRRLLHLLETFFVCVALLCAFALSAASALLAHHWLNVEHLPIAEVELSIRMMAVLVGLRWTCGLYRGAISGFERLVWLSGFNAAAASVRFILVIPYFLLIGASATDFFRYQLAVAVLELICLVIYTYRLMPAIEPAPNSNWNWRSLGKALRFSIGIALTSSIWVLVTQTDKLILSKLLSLTDFAFFTLAVLVASSVLLISAPITAAVLPRMTRLCAENDDAGLLKVYRNATQLVCVIAAPVTMLLSMFSRQVLWAWTGDPQIADQAAPVLHLYALGNGFLALAAFPYYLQFAKGDLKLHVVGHLLFLVLLIPALIAATWRWGVIGAGYAWLIANAVYFLAWVPQIHARFYKGLHSDWIFADLSPIVGLAAFGVIVAQFAVAPSSDRVATAAQLVVVGLLLLLLAACGSTWARSYLFQNFETRIGRET